MASVIGGVDVVLVSEGGGHRFFFLRFSHVSVFTLTDMLYLLRGVLSSSKKLFTPGCLR